VRHVKGVLFVDYVRMLRACKGVDWRALLEPEDTAFLAQRIDHAAWYPMASFEHMGNAIFATVAQGNLAHVKMWGQRQAQQLRQEDPKLLAADDPVETLNRFHVLRQTFFDFDALEVLFAHDDEAQIVIRYYMGMPAEECASVQTMGFFEGLLALAGATEVQGRLAHRSWQGDANTRLDLAWRPPGSVK
jgi:hypothetical protein